MFHNQIVQNNIIEKFYKNNIIPNLLIIGDHDINKKLFIINYIHNYYDNNDVLIKSQILNLNIVIDRSIKKIREIIKKFINEISYEDKNKNTILKYIIIENVENITCEIQYALRRIIEDNNKKIRFILIGNNSQVIIQPLISRCLLIYFNKDDFQKNNKNVFTLYSKTFFENNRDYINNNIKNKIKWEDIILENDYIKLFHTLNDFFKNNTNYYYILNDFMDWILKNNKLSDEDKLNLFKKITYQFSKIMNNNNFFLNLFNIFIYYLYLIN